MARISLLLLWLLSGMLPASDLALEQRYAEQLEAGLVQGTAQRLKAGDSEFLALHQEVDGDVAQGGAILMHGPGAHPDWLDVIHPLRVGLPKHGWETLSIQMPLAGPGAGVEEYVDLLPEAFPRIEAALAYFKSRKIEHVVLIGHGLGARAGLLFLGEKKPPQRKAVKGLVMIGLALDKEDEKSIAALKAIKLPVLDLYGSSDKEAVIASQELRRRMAGYADNKGYQQSEMLGADHFFRGQSQMLLLRIRGWLGKNLPNPKPLSYKDLKK